MAEQELEESLCGGTPGSGSRRRLGARERAGEAPGTLGDLLSLSCLTLGIPISCPPHRGLSWPHFGDPCWTVVEKEVDTVLWCPEERVGVEDVQIEPRMWGAPLASLEGSRMLNHPLLGF